MATTWVSNELERKKRDRRSGGRTKIEMKIKKVRVCEYAEENLNNSDVLFKNTFSDRIILLSREPLWPSR